VVVAVADGAAESVGEAVAVAAGVFVSSAGDTVGDTDAAGDEAEADGDGETGTVADGLVCGDGDAVAVDDAVAEGVGEQCGVGRVRYGTGAGNVPASNPVPGVGEARTRAAMPVTTGSPVLNPPDAEGLHSCWRAAPCDGEAPFPVLFPPWAPGPLPDKVPLPLAAPPPPFVPPPLSPVSTVEPTCTMAARNGGTVRPMHATKATLASMAATGRNQPPAVSRVANDRRDRASKARDRASKARDRASKTTALSVQCPRHSQFRALPATPRPAATLAATALAMLSSRGRSRGPDGRRLVLARIRSSPSAAGSIWLTAADNASRSAFSRSSSGAVMPSPARRLSHDVSCSKIDRSADIPRAVWLFTAPRLIPIVAAISASDRSA
jgi:hypothetical protein